eukprot:TRINITY_DN76782_c0_g1_i1.p1 TRINITY_DN76782_c0_g1~~TRINITY_DN76782_c0_g1_i1.p1  ORF type:complete len:190 (+),score=49.85 TRINITY_DN76782_c0_g1_i1:122-691(+)
MPGSVRSSNAPSRRSRSSSSAAAVLRAVKPTERKERTVGECKCSARAGRGRGLQFNDDKILTTCTCLKVQPRAYNPEIYAALTKRGGALWERHILEVIREVEGALRGDSIDDDFKKAFKKGKQMVKPPDPVDGKTFSDTKAGSEAPQASLRGLMMQMEEKWHNQFLSEPYAREADITDDMRVFPLKKKL